MASSLSFQQVINFVKKALKSKDVPMMKRAVAIYEKWENNAIGGNHLDKLPNDILDFIKTKIPLKKCNKIKLYQFEAKHKQYEEDPDFFSFTFTDANNNIAKREMGNPLFYKKRLSMLWINSVKEKLNWVVGDEIFINTRDKVNNNFIAFSRKTKCIYKKCPYDLEIDKQGYLYGSYWKKTTESYVRVKLNCRYNDCI